MILVMMSISFSYLITSGIRINQKPAMGQTDEDYFQATNHIGKRNIV